MKSTFRSTQALACAQEIVCASQALHAHGFLAACDANLSCRLSDNMILITPSGVPKRSLRAKDMLLMDLNGQAQRGRPSSEKLLHLEIYQRCPEARFVIHAHPPVAIAWSIARPKLKFLPGECLSELILAAGAVPFVPYARPGTEGMAENIRPFMPQYRALILSRHGAVTWGESLTEALNGMERLEHTAIVLKYAIELGGLSSLPPKEVAALKALRKRLGPRLL